MKWIRPRYAQAPNRFHAVRTTSGGSAITECNGRWPTGEVVDELATEGTGSGAIGSEKCKACLELLASASGESVHSGEGG